MYVLCWYAMVLLYSYSPYDGPSSHIEAYGLSVCS